MPTARVAVVGAGIAGLVAATDLARAGFEVQVFERAAAPGGKMREVELAGRRMDAGPTVFTMRDVFEEIYADAGTSLAAELTLKPALVLARHAWSAHERLDLHADLQHSAAAIGDFAGSREADGFLRFAAQAQRIYGTLNRSFMRAPKPNPVELGRRIGLGHFADLWNIQPFVTLWSGISRYFRDPRLRQLFARYATYCGSSPFQSPATLMLVAYVEQSGVWYVEGGMHRLAASLADLAQGLGARIRYGSEVAKIHLRSGRPDAVELTGGERVPVDCIVSNADNNALNAGLFGAEVRDCVPGTPLRARSLSALTWNLVAHTEGFELARHSVFFSADYRAEFDDIFKLRRLPRQPTVYICAQDRFDGAGDAALESERLLCLVNAPATGDIHDFAEAEIERCATTMYELLARCGLRVECPAAASQATSPADFNRLFPSTGGALYGPASHGWMTSFTRPGSRSAVPGLYLAGGSTHPGPGVPMAAISGRLAAASLAADYASIARFRSVAMPGGISTR